MGLFDELLPKSNSSQSANPGSGGSGTQQDPLAEQVITITESAPIITTPTETHANEVTEAVIPEAIPVEKIAEDNSILIMDQQKPEETKEESISDLLDIKEDTIAFLKEEETKEETPIQMISNSDLLDTEGFFENEKETPKKEEAIFSIVGASEDTTQTPVTPKSFKEYIHNAILSATTLLKNLSKQDAEKLAKEHEYEEQQIHFAELAKQAEEEHKKILAEKEQAEKMIAYLEKEEKKADQGIEDTATAIENIEELKTTTKKISKKEATEESTEPKENISLI